MRTSVIMLSGVVAIAIGMTLPGLAQETPSVDEIVKKANHMTYYQGRDGRARVKMTITDKQGRTRQKEFTILRMNADDKDQAQKFFVYFHQPPDERGTVFMVHKHVGKDDDRWLYLPALDLVKQIAASDERTSFVGSHFFYEDVSGRGIDEDEHVLEKTTDTAYVIKNKPKNPQVVEFDSYTVWVDKKFFIPFQIEFEKGGEVYRTAKALKVSDITGKDGTVYKTVVKSQMTDKASGGNTVIDYTTVEYGIGLQDEIFTERYLRKPPQNLLE